MTAPRSELDDSLSAAKSATAKPATTKPATGRSVTAPVNTSGGIEDMKLTWFHKRLTVYSAGGPFLDGFALAIIGVALAQLGPAWQLDGVWQGLLAASALVGLLVGGVVGGYITDRIGRTLMYTLDLLVIAASCIAQFWVEEPVALLVLRFILGIGIGADYPIATSLLAEFAPRKHRGSMLGWLTAMWAAGSAAAYIVGELLLGLGDDAWRWILLSPAVPAIILVIARWGTPESPRWLLSKGRIEEAQASLIKAFGPNASLDDLESEDEGQRTSLRTLFTPPYLSRMVFVCVFWTCSILPIYAIYSFAPALLEAFHLSDPNQRNFGEAAVGLIFLVGCIAATLLANRLRRRTLLIVPFTLSTLGLLGLGLFPESGPIIIVALFSLYAITIGGPTILQWIYPNELFPTQVRATAVGLGTSVSRVGAAIGTFLTPILLNAVGIGTTMLIAAGVSLVGVTVSFFMAPETKDRSLADTSSIRLP